MYYIICIQSAYIYIYTWSYIYACVYCVSCIYAFALICASVFQNTSGVLIMPLYTVLSQQWEPGRRTVDANLKSGTIEVLHNPRRLLSANRIGSSAPGSQQQLGRLWQQHKRCPKWFRSQSIELQAYCVHICVCVCTHIQKYHAISINID